MEEMSLDKQEQKPIKKYSGNKIKIASTNKLTVAHKEILPSNKKGNDKVIIYMSNLNCANCAAKIETKSKEIEGVVNSTLNFMSKKLILDIEDKSVKNSVISDA